MPGLLGALAIAIGQGAGPAGEVGDAAGALRGGCLAYLDWAREEPGGYALLFTARRDSLRGGGPSGTEAFEALTGGIAACQEAGVAKDGDPAGMALLVWASLHGISTLSAARPGIEWPSNEALVDDLLTGIVGLPSR